jgi:secernin
MFYDKHPFCILYIYLSCLLAGNFKAQDMMSILRHEDSGICMTGGFTSTGSQVSILPPKDSGAPCVHFLTGTANPSKSLFKPFVFTENASIGDKTTSPTFGDKDPAKIIPRFQSTVDRQHPLWRAHQHFLALLERDDPKGTMLLSQIREMEAHSTKDLEDLVKQGKLDAKASAKLGAMFQHMVDLELNFYKMS